MQIDNNYVEKFGTGKLTAIIKTGKDRWGELITFFIGRTTEIVVSFVFTAYMLMKHDVLYLFIFIVIYIFFYVISYFLNLGALSHRRKRRDYSNNLTKNLVKILMNKQEIFQSGKIQHEVDILNDYDDKQIFHNKRIADYLCGMFE